MKLDFDPNKPDNRVWATYIPGRRGPAFKLHAKRAYATSAFSYQNGGILFRHDGEKWVEVCRYGDGILMRTCCVKGCHAKILPEELYYGDEYRRLVDEGFERGMRVWVDKNSDAPSFAVVCQEHKAQVARMKLKSPLPIELKGAS